MAARARRENEVAAAVRRRLDTLAPARLTGTRPGILSMFVEDTDRAEWRGLRDRLELEGEMRQFLTHPEARPVVAVTCTSRLELFAVGGPDAAADGELRFRNPAHPAAKAPGPGSGGAVLDLIGRRRKTFRAAPHKIITELPRSCHVSVQPWRYVRDEGQMTETEYAHKLDELERLLNDPEVQMEPARVWSLLAEISACEKAGTAPRIAGD